MHYHIQRPWRVHESLHTPRDVYLSRTLRRRAFLQSLGVAAAGIGVSGLLGGCSQPTLEEIEQAGASPPPTAEPGLYPAKRNGKYEYGRPETARLQALRHTNFYEFGVTKETWKHVGAFRPTPWSVEITGLCAKPRTMDLDDIHREMTLEERHYRHRCVERWAMCVPWTGFPLRDLLALVEPLPEARYVEFQTFYRPEESPGVSPYSSYTWPYTEGLTLDEATNELTLLATGLYGEPLAKQNGAPIRLVVPWKYGFKSIKSIVRIELRAHQPATFWNNAWPEAYDFTANVDPDVPHPTWSQKVEEMLGTGERYPTVLYNGYGEHVAGLYA